MDELFTDLLNVILVSNSFTNRNAYPTFSGAYLGKLTTKYSLTRTSIDKRTS
ncbi:hypothetical protein [Echinicola shivajiensis]|uniref:hypothetical protein n=1 Tax=Echinicola shivajiensis TaxID=1035916 RepID=UPI001BFC1CFC|nr:hypothetical protein [Echinicola shivajiensis]